MYVVKPIDSVAIAPLIKATDTRMKLLRKLPEKWQYVLKIEKIIVTDEWDNFYQDEARKIEKTKEAQIELTQSQMNKVLFFLQFTSEFYEHNGSDDRDKDYVTACQFFLKQHSDIEDEKFVENLFKGAFGQTA